MGLIEDNNVRQYREPLLTRLLPDFLLSDFAREKRIRRLNEIKSQMPEGTSDREQKLVNKLNRRIYDISNPGKIERQIKSILTDIRGGQVLGQVLIAKDELKKNANRSSRREIQKMVDNSQSTIHKLDRDLAYKGIQTKLDHAAIGDILSGRNTFVARDQSSVQSGKLLQELTYKKSFGQYIPAHNEITFQKPVIIEKKVIAGVDIQELDKRMTRDWNKDYLSKSAMVSSDPATNKKMLDEAGSILGDLLKIRGSKDPDAARIHDQLAYKHFSGTPNVKAVGDLKAMQNEYETKARVDLGTTAAPSFSKEQMANLLSGRPVAAAPEKGGGQKWYQIDPSKKDAQGLHMIAEVPNGRKSSVEVALLSSAITAMKDPEGMGRDAKKMLKNGDSVQATVIENGVKVERIVSLDVANNRLTVNREASEAKNLVSKSQEPGHEKIRQYLEGVEKINKAGQAAEEKKKEKKEGSTKKQNPDNRSDTPGKKTSTAKQESTAQQTPATAAKSTTAKETISNTKTEGQNTPERTRPVLIKRDRNAQENPAAQSRPALTVVPRSSGEKELKQDPKIEKGKLAAMVFKDFDELMQKGTKMDNGKTASKTR